MLSPYPYRTNDPYIHFLLARKQKAFYTKPYVGNSGDALIRLGTIQLLSDLDIKTTVNPKKADVILWPGGNPTMWSGNINGWQETWARFPEKEFVVGPSTFQMYVYDWSKMINESKAKITGLFARDPESFKNLQKASLPKTINIGLSHDPALYLRNCSWLEEHKEAVTQEYVLLAFRDDHEADSSKRGPLLKAFNLSLKFFALFLPTTIVYGGRQLIWRCDRDRRAAVVARKMGSNCPLKVCDASKLDFESFVDTVRRAKEVHTDRLHTLLLSVMLGKPVFAYPTSYGKLEAIYEHSLKSWSNIKFVFFT